MSKNCSASCTNSTFDDSWFIRGVKQGSSKHRVTSVTREGSRLLEGDRQEQQREEGAKGAICIAAIAFAISVAWSSLNTTTGNGRGISGGVGGIHPLMCLSSLMQFFVLEV